MNYVQQLLISLPGQSDAPCRAGYPVIMLDCYKSGTNSIALHLQVPAWPRSAISLQAAGPGQVKGTMHLPGCGDDAIAGSHPQGHSLGLSQERSGPWAQAKLKPAVQVELDEHLHNGGHPGASSRRGSAQRLPPAGRQPQGASAAFIRQTVIKQAVTALSVALPAQLTRGSRLSSTLRPRSPPAQAAAISPRETSASGVGT